MNKFRFILLSTFVILGTVSASAQQKAGYISLDQVVSLMPEVRKVDSLLQRYQADSLNPQFSYMLTEYNRKDSIANGKDSLKTPAPVRAQIRQELEGLAYQLQNWQSIVQNALQEKQGQLLEPIYVKAVNALNTVAKENNITYVYNKEALLVAPPGDDLLPLVAKKLNLKLPNTTAPAGTPKK